jgi:ParB/RepB/Spo0J family partition protein
VSESARDEAASSAEWTITKIISGHRHRVDFGDIDSLAASIDKVGLLHPIVICPDGRLIAGARRLAAFKQLEREKIPVTVVDIEKIVLGEYAENTERKDFTYAEVVEILRAVKPLEEKAARERQRLAGPAHGRGKKCFDTASGNLPTAVKGRAADKTARATGKKRRTLEKALAVVEAAEQNPQSFGDLAEQLKQDDVRVDAVHREMKQRQERAAYEARADRSSGIGDLLEMAKAGRRFKVIYGDPPWKLEVYSGKGKQRSADRYYDTASLETIKALPIATLADTDCALFLWGVWPAFPAVLEVITAWGFEYKTVAFVWVKTTPKAGTIGLDGDGLHWGMGYWTRANTEYCLLATKGSPSRLAQDVHQVVVAPVGEHSEKPERVRERIEALLVGPHLEIFARRRVPGWTVWGNEVDASP